MPSGKAQHSVLIVSASDKIFSSVLKLIPSAEYNPVLRAKSAGEARRILLENVTDIIIINTPLPDEFGTQLALDLSELPSGILMLVKSDLYEQNAYKTEDSGIFTLPKPSSGQMIYGAVKLVSVYASRLKSFEKRARTVQEKMVDIRTINRAKWLLIENLNMSESDAHHYIEKQAMDSRITRREAAEGIIRTYDN